VRADDVADALEPERFRPFVLKLSNGDTYEIKHPEQIVVSRSALAIGTRRRNGRRHFEKVDTVLLLHVVSMVPIEEVEVK
jgi:hypothetical protein